MRIEDAVTITEAAALKGVSRQAIFLAIKAGKIRVVRAFGSSKMLNRNDVEKYKPRAKKDGTP